MWQAIRSHRPPVPNSAVYSSKQGFRAGRIDGFRVLSRLMSDGNYLTFCPVRVAHLLTESEDCGRFVCGSKVDPKVELTHGDDTCAICLEAMDKPSQVIRARCGHLFHRKCWKQTWKKNLRACALCRHPMKSALYDSWAPEDADEDDFCLLKANGWHRYSFSPRVTRSSKAK